MLAPGGGLTSCFWDGLCAYAIFWNRLCVGIFWPLGGQVPAHRSLGSQVWWLVFWSLEVFLHISLVLIWGPGCSGCSLLSVSTWSYLCVWMVSVGPVCSYWLLFYKLCLEDLEGIFCVLVVVLCSLLLPQNIFLLSIFFCFWLTIHKGLILFAF